MNAEIASTHPIIYFTPISLQIKNTGMLINCYNPLRLISVSAAFDYSIEIYSCFT